MPVSTALNRGGKCDEQAALVELRSPGYRHCDCEAGESGRGEGGVDVGGVEDVAFGGGVAAPDVCYGVGGYGEGVCGGRGEGGSVCCVPGVGGHGGCGVVGVVRSVM